MAHGRRKHDVVTIGFDLLSKMILLIYYGASGWIRISGKKHLLMSSMRRSDSLVDRFSEANLKNDDPLFLFVYAEYSSKITDSEAESVLFSLDLLDVMSL